MKKILICEDEQDVQASLKNMLSRRNYDVQGAANGTDALELAKKFQPDLILLDIRMAKIDGIEVARTIRESDTKVKILFVTAFDSLEIKKEAARYDISGYIVKPFPIENLLQTVEQTLK